MTEKAPPLDLVGRAAARIARETLTTETKFTPPSPPPVQDAPLPTTDQQPLPANVDTTGTTGAGGGQVELDFASLHKEGFLTPYNQKSQIAEEFRVLKRPLLRIAFDSRKSANGIGHVILVTSSRPEDGKTFISTNLALSMASERDLFVLLIDADIRRVGLSKKLGVGIDRG